MKYRVILAIIFFANSLWLGSAISQSIDKPIGILLAGGDISSCDDDYVWKKYANKTAAIIRDEIAKAASKEPEIPVRVLALGDLAYAKGKKEEFDCFANRWSGFDEVLRPVPGNHEYQSAGAKPYFKFFENNKFVHQQVDDQVYLKGYFTENFPTADGPWLLVGLNSNFSQNSPAEIGQKKWLKEQLLANNLVPCVLAFWHAPIFSSGRHGHTPYSPTGRNLPLSSISPMQSEFHILHSYGASVVLTGHDHNYEQFKRHDAKGNETDDGVRSFVVGTAGSLLSHDFYTKIHAASDGGPFGKGKLKNGNQGILKIILYQNRYEWQYLSIKGPDHIPAEMKELTSKDNCNSRISTN